MPAYEIRYHFPGEESVEGIRVINTRENETDEVVESIFRDEEKKWRGDIPLPDPVVHSIRSIDLFY